MCRFISDTSHSATGPYLASAFGLCRKSAVLYPPASFSSQNALAAALVDSFVTGVSLLEYKNIRILRMKIILPGDPKNENHITLNRLKVPGIDVDVSKVRRRDI